MRHDTRRVFTHACSLCALTLAVGCTSTPPGSEGDELGQVQQSAEGTPPSSMMACATSIPCTQPLLAAGSYHTVALRSDRFVWAWGLNSSNQIGTNLAGGSYNTPQRVRSDGGDSGFLEEVVAVAAGDSHSLALETYGTIRAWGLNSSGQLGNGTTTTPLVAGRVWDSTGSESLSNVVAIAAGGAHSLAVKSDGSVWAWGSNSSGQLGIGVPASTTGSSGRAIQVVGPEGTGTLDDVVAVAAGNSFSLALKQDGSVWS